MVLSFMPSEAIEKRGKAVIPRSGLGSRVARYIINGAVGLKQCTGEVSRWFSEALWGLDAARVPHRERGVQRGSFLRAPGR